MAEEQLIIEVKYDDHGAKQKVDSLTKSFEALNTVTSGKGFTQLNNVAKSLESLGQSLSGISGAGSSLREVARSASALSTAFKSFDGKSVRGLDRIATALNSIKIQNKSLDAVSKLANGLGKLTSAAKDSDLAQNLQAVSKSIATFAQDVVSNISEDTLSRFERLGAAMAGLSSGSGKSFNTSNMSSGAKAASKIFSDLGNNIRKVIRLGWELGKLPFKMILSPIKSIGQGLMDMGTRFNTFLRGIGRIALYRAIRTGIKLVTSAVKEGVNNLYEWAGIVGNSFKPTMDSLATSFTYLRNSIGAAVSPLLDWVAPIVDTIIDKFVSVINVFNQLVATLTGASTWRKATKQAVSYGDAADNAAKGTNNANKAAKELRRTLLGFDEINRLDDEKNSSKTPSTGSGSGNGGSNVNALTFTEQAISQPIKDLAKKIKDAWAKGDFTQIGSDIASKIADGLNSIDWDKKVKPTVKKLATSAGTLINGMFDYNGSKGGKKLWDAIARTIYNGINTAILGYVTFFNTVKWEGIGAGIGAALKKILKNINWTKGNYSVGDALAAFPNAVIDAFTGFSKQFTANDFYKFGNNLGKAVTKALKKIKWKELFDNAITIATGILSAFNGLLEGFDWSGVKDAILKGIKKIPKGKWSTLGIQIGRAIFNVVTFVGYLVDMLVSSIKEGKWGELVRGIKEGISQKIKEKGGWKGVSKGIADFISKNLGAISLLFSFLMLKPLLKGAIKGMFGNALASSLGGTYSATGGGMIKGIKIGALVSLGVDIASNIVGGKGAKKDEETTPEGVLGKLASYTGKGAVAGSLLGPIGALFGGLASGFAGMTSEAYAKDVFSPENNKKWNETVDDAWSDIGSLFGLDYKGTGKFEKKNDVIKGSNNVLGWLGRLLGGTTANAAQPENVGLATNLKPPKGASELYTPNGKQYAIDIRGNLVEVSSKKLKTKQKTISGMVGSIGSTIQKKLNLKKNPLTGMQAIISKVEESLEPGSKTSSGWLAKYTKDPEGEGIKGKEITGFTANYAEKTGAAIKPFTLLDNKIEYKNRFGEAIEEKFTLKGNTAQYDNRTGAAQTAFTLKGNTAQYDKKANGGGLTPTTISNWTAKFTKREAVEKNLKTTVSGWLAKFTDKDSGWKKEKNLVGTKSGWKAEFTKKDGSSKKLIGSKSGWIAEFTKRDDSSKNLKGTTSGWTAKFTKAKESIPKNDKKVTGFTAIISAMKGATQKIASAFGISLNKATGGVYKNGQWYPVTQFAAGGLPGNSGQMFIAREAGPELVGTIGGNTAVMNNDQIVASVSAGVARAVASVMGGGNAPTIEVTIKADSETLYRTVKRGERMANNRYGTAIAMG